MMVRVFVNGPGDLGSIPGRVIPKSQKWYLMPPCLTLSIIRYVSRVKGVNPGKRLAPSLPLGVVAIEKGALGSPSTTVTNFAFTYLFFFNRKMNFSLNIGMSVLIYGRYCNI